MWGDQAYRGQTEVIQECAPQAQDCTHRRYRYKDHIDEVERAKNRTKSTVRSKVEHVFGVLKLKFGFVKVRSRDRVGRCRCQEPRFSASTNAPVGGWDRLPVATTITQTLPIGLDQN